MGRTYEPPKDIDLSEVVPLLPAHKQKQELTPDTPVICLNRGPKELRDMHDAQEYVIPPGAKFQVAYATAQHFQRRLIVPGTRNPNVHDTSVPLFVSWIAIFGVDPPEACQPFTDEQLKRFGEKAEGLNREVLGGSDRDVQVRSTGELASGLAGLGLVSSAAMGGVGGGVSQEVVGGTAETREAALAPVEGSDAKSDFARGEAAGWQPPQSEADLTVHSAPPPAEARRTANRRGR